MNANARSIPNDFVVALMHSCATEKVNENKGSDERHMDRDVDFAIDDDFGENANPQGRSGFPLAVKRNSLSEHVVNWEAVKSVKNCSKFVNSVHAFPDDIVLDPPCPGELKNVNEKESCEMSNGDLDECGLLVYGLEKNSNLRYIAKCFIYFAALREL